MKRFLTLLILPVCLFSVKSTAQVQTDDEGFPTFTLQEGDTSYVMRQYVFVMLKAGPNREHSAEEVQQIQQGHMEHMAKMAEDGHLAVAGPFGDNGDWRGIYIFNVNSVEKVRELVAGDPAIIAGRLEAEIHPWWAARGSKLP